MLSGFGLKLLRQQLKRLENCAHRGDGRPVMALVRCPECDSTISDNARTCPRCGCGLITKAQQIADRNQQIADWKAAKQVEWFWIILLLSGAAVVGILLLLDLLGIVSIK